MNGRGMVVAVKAGVVQIAVVLLVVAVMWMGGLAVVRGLRGCGGNGNGIEANLNSGCGDGGFGEDYGGDGEEDGEDSYGNGNGRDGAAMVSGDGRAGRGGEDGGGDGMRMVNI